MFNLKLIEVINSVVFSLTNVLHQETAPIIKTEQFKPIHVKHNRELVITDSKNRNAIDLDEFEILNFFSNPNYKLYFSMQLDYPRKIYSGKKFINITYNDYPILVISENNNWDCTVIRENDVFVGTVSVDLETKQFTTSTGEFCYCFALDRMKSSRPSECRYFNELIQEENLFFMQVDGIANPNDYSLYKQKVLAAKELFEINNENKASYIIPNYTFTEGFFMNDITYNENVVREIINECRNYEDVPKSE